MKTDRSVELRVADEVWIATALLHREHPECEDFPVREVVRRASQENVTGSLRPGVRQFVVLHCVANKPPNPGRDKMLFETSRGRRRLYRPDDPADPNRTGKTVPDDEAIPPQYRYLLDWYRKEYSRSHAAQWLGGLEEMIGFGKQVFAGQDPDEYVRSLREGWD